MTITIRILKTANVPANPFPPLPASITAEFAIQNDAVSSTWYKWTRGGIPPETSDVQAFLDTEGAALYVDAQAGGVTMTQAQVNQGNYSYQHWAHKDTIGAASFRLEAGMFTLGTSPTVGAFRTALTNTLTELAPLAGTDFETHFNNKRAAAGLAGAVSGFSLAQCNQFDSLLREWLSARKSDVLWAKSIVGLS